MRDVAALPVTGDADIAAVAALLADPARCKVLLALDDGWALPASVLAEEAGVSRSAASVAACWTASCRRAGSSGPTAGGR